jgi:hypothetical protein
VIGLGLAAVHYVPAYEFMRLSVRSSLSYQELAGGFAWRDMLQFLLPGVFTYWSPMYVGILPLFLAILACVIGSKRARKGESLFWLGVALVSLALSFGGKGYLYRLFYWVVPGFRLFRSQERAIYLTSFCLAVLAGWGWQLLYVENEERAVLRTSSWCLLALGVGALISIVAAWMASNPPEPETVDWLRPLALLAVLASMSWALARWVPGRAAWGAALVLCVVAFDLSIINMPNNLVLGPAESRVYDGSWLETVLDGDGLYRIANEWGLPGNVGCWLGQHDVYGASPLRLSAHKTMADALPHWRLWQLLDVRYVATWEHDLPGPFAWQRVAMRGQEWAKDTVYAFRLESDFPRAWAVHRARQVDDGDALQLLADPVFDPFAEVLLPRGTPAGTTAEGPSLAPVVEVIQYAPERIVVRADMSAPGWLVLGEWHYPGWRVQVDGRKENIHRVNYGLRGVPLASGEHVVEFTFRPSSVYVGALISVSVLAAFLGVWSFWSGGRDDE